jgi:predicted acetyltransferase
MQIEVTPALAEQQPILANLLELYAHDFSELHEIRIGADGKFGYDSLPLYWSDPGRYPFLVWTDGKLAGLVLVKRGSQVSGNQDVMDIAEFFVLRPYRKQGIGTHVAHHIWRRFPGLREVRVMQSNVAACKFWSCAISSFVGEKNGPLRVEIDGKPWDVFSFESPRDVTANK